MPAAHTARDRLHTAGAGYTLNSLIVLYSDALPDRIGRRSMLIRQVREDKHERSEADAHK